MTGLLQDGVDDVDDHILSNNIRFDDSSLVVLGGDHVDVLLENCSSSSDSVFSVDLYFGRQLQGHFSSKFSVILTTPVA